MYDGESVPSPPVLGCSDNLVSSRTEGESSHGDDKVHCPNAKSEHNCLISSGCVPEPKCAVKSDAQNEFQTPRLQDKHNAEILSSLSAGHGCCNLSPHTPGACYHKKREVKLKHTSFDGPKTSTKEYALKACPSLDSSFTSNKSNVDLFPSNSSLLDPCCCPPVTQPYPPLSPSTPASGITSQASLDSGVLSAHSFDFPQNIGLEVSDQRRRTASSVSSGIGEMWQISLDSDHSKENGVEGSLNEKTASAVSTDGSNISNELSNHTKQTHCQNKSSSNAFEDSLSVKPACDLAAHKQVDQSYISPDTLSESYNASALSVIFPAASEESVVPVSNIGETNLHLAEIPKHNRKLEKIENRVSSIKETNIKTNKVLSLAAQKKIEKFAEKLVMLVLNEAYAHSISLGWSIKCSGQCNQELCREDYRKKSLSREKRERGEKSLFSALGFSSCSSSLCWTPELPFSPSHRSYSRASKRSSLSFSHDSLVGCAPCQDDSHLIKGAVSHDILVFPPEKTKREKRHNGNAAYLEDDIYSQPVDVVKPYDGPILQPKVITHQPKRRPNRSVQIQEEQVETTKRRTNGNKEKGSKHNRKSKNAFNIESSLNRRNRSQPSTTEIKTQSNDDHYEHCSENGTCREIHKSGNTNSAHNVKVTKSLDQGRVCKIMPFSSSKSHKRKEVTDAKVDKKKKSFSSNIRNTLVTLFSFRKSPHKDHKEHGNFINAKNEFIDASQGLIESSEGLKWGKICPLPSAPPLRSSVKCSAFTDRIGSVKESSAVMKQHSSNRKVGITLESKSGNANNAYGSNNTNHQRQSNSISPASLLSCLGHPRTSSIDEHEERPRVRRSSEVSKGHPPSTVSKRALPPLPPVLGKAQNFKEESVSLDGKPHSCNKLDEGCDFASIIEKVKNYGWYWGPISGEAAEKVLSNEPDGSFIVRDSSDYHYIFSLTFRLNGVTRHVRIEHDQGNFSFGGFTRFKSQTIVDFIEKAVEHSRSGRYLFFLHRRPVLGPMRVQLLHPVSRFKHVQSLQHLCRFVIVKQVRKDLIHDLPLPQRLKDYLSSPHYYSEQVEQCMSSSAASLEGATAASAVDILRSRSPCLRHVSQARVKMRFSKNDCSLVPPHDGIRSCSNRISLQEPAAVTTRPSVFRCSFNEPGTSYDLSKCLKSREFRLSSSHSSLENSFMQMYPVSPSTASSESNSGKPCSHFTSSKFSQRRKRFPLYGSSRSSPSSPVPFDYSPDWLSSSDDFHVVANHAKFPSTNCRTSLTTARPEDNFHRLSFENGHLLRKSPTHRHCWPSASSTSQSVSDAFVIDESRTVFNAEKVSPKSTTDSEYSCRNSLKATQNGSSSAARTTNKPNREMS